MGTTEKGFTWGPFMVYLAGVFELYILIVGFTQMLFVYHVTNCLYPRAYSYERYYFCDSQPTLLRDFNSLNSAYSILSYIYRSLSPRTESLYNIRIMYGNCFLFPLNQLSPFLIFFRLSRVASY